jgi:hypothetical protein
MSRIEHIVVAVLALSAISLVASAENSGLTREEAFEKAVCFSGFGAEPEAADSIRDAGVLTRLGPAGVPFLKPSHSESSFWLFDFGVRPFGQQNRRDTTVVDRPVIVYVESVRDSGLVWIRSTKPGYNPVTYTWDTASVPDSLYPPRWGYDGIPGSCPPYSLARLLASQPVNAGEPALIDAVCLISQRGRYGTGRVWVLVMHDYTTSAQLRSREGEFPDRWQRHGYSTLSAETGKWMRSGNMRMYNEEWPPGKAAVPLGNW